VSAAGRRGFTLIEVLVALAIAAIGLAAVLAVVTNSSRNAVYLRDKTYASWIGQNKITEIRLGATMPSVDKTSGDLEFAGQKWKWEQTVTQTEVPGMRRIDVAVRFADSPADQAVATVTGFVGRTQLAAPPSTTSWEVNTAVGPATTPGTQPGLNPGLSPTPRPGSGGSN
jgi:general secretion pathway protein I